MIMRILVIQDKNEKRKFIEVVDNVFPRGLVNSDSYEEIFEKIDKNALFIGAYSDEKPVGYAAIYANDTSSKTAFITKIGVLDYMQGKHIGSGLMNKCIEESKANGMDFIRLEVHNTNTKAIEFYHYCGFEYEKKCSDVSTYLIMKI